MSSPPPPVQRLRLRYAKTGDARFIGHLDEARFWERVFRRVDLPIAYSHGFNPQARMQFAAALPVGVEGENEWLDVWLAQSVEPADWLDRIRHTLPRGFALHELCEAPLDLPAMQASLRLAEYEASWGLELSPELLARRVSELLAAPTLPRPHHKEPGRIYDLRPLIVSLDVTATADGPLLRMTLQSSAAGNARVSEVIAALGLDAWPHRVRRTALIL